MTKPANILAPTSTSSGKLAPSRALSPVRSASHSVSALPRMPSPRGSPALRPTSPLSGYKPAPQYDTLQLPRNVHSRAATNDRRRGIDASLKLSSLPRFHPAKYPSANSSLQGTPNAPSPNAPTSPRSHQRVMSDVQKQLLAYQREMVSAARGTSPGDRPISPRLQPLGSPGPVLTPLELEGNDGYLVAGLKGASRDGKDSAELVDALIREEEARRRQRLSQGSGGAEDR